MIRSVCIFVASASLALLGGCEPTPSPSDGGSPAATEDAGTPDAGLDEDAGVPDAGVQDAGVPDAGTLTALGGNGVWLTRNYVAYSSFYDPAVVDELADRMSSQYDVGRWFVNVDRVGADGRFIKPVPNANEFLDNVARWEERHDARFEVYAWVNGSTEGTAAIDLNNPAVRAVVVEECQKLLAPSVEGSLVARTRRPFDGVQIDFEPSGFDQVRFDALLALMDELRAGFAAVGRPDARLSVAAHKLGTGGDYQWSPAFYYAMARRVDLVAGMTYNSGSVDGAAYQDWMAAQVYGVLRAVSGRAWADGAHPAPENPVEVLFGLPSYPANPNHAPAAENIAFGADGMRAGVTRLQDGDDPSLSHLGGAAVYLHTKGTADDGYARWNTEWWWFGRHWLQRW